MTIDPKTLNVYHFNRLTPTQAELLALISEESGEVVQIVGKILRHGLTSCHPDGGPQNSRLLEIEIGDLLAATRLIAADGMIDMVRVEDAADEKLRKVFKYLHHAPAQPEPQPEPKREETVAEAPISEDHEYPSIGYDIELRKRWAALLGMDPEGYFCGVPAFVDIYSRCQELWPAPSPDPVEQKREEKVQAACDHCDNLALIERDGEKFCISCIPDDIRRKPATSPAPDECPTFSDGTPIFPGRVKTAPVAGELELPVRQALERLRFDAQGCFNAGSFRLAATIRSEADALETWARSQASPDSSDEDRAFDNGYAKGRLDEMARSQAQPVAVGMSEELEVVLRLAAQHVEGWRQLYQSPEYREQMLTAIAAVRAQAASAQPGMGLPKVREWHERIKKSADNAYCDSLAQFKRTECLGWEAKVRSGKFGSAEMDAHKKANELMGRHQAFAAVSRDLTALLAELGAQPKAVPVEAIKILRNEWATGQMTEQACHEIDRWLAQVEGE